jgi:tetratricopeptide (TPR) repeat protein
MDFMVDSLNALARSRAEACELWAELEPYRFEDQYYLVRTHQRFLAWGFCELLCQESVRLTVVDAAKAVERAELAVLVSDLMKDDDPVTDRRLYQLRGYAWAHDGNARRVLGDLRSADESFSIADAWWEAGEGLGDCLGYEPMFLELKASMRIAQRRFPEAFALLDRMFAIHTLGDRPEHRDAHLAGRALVKKALALAEMNEPERSIELLEQAEPMLDLQRDPRLVLCLRHNLLWDLTTVERYAEAGSRLPSVEALCRELGNPLDLIRLRWAEGRIAAGQGHTEEAIQLLRGLRQEFVAREMAFDAALITLELTELYARQGSTAEVKELSVEMASIFRAQDVPREALAALLFFQKAAERERATAELAREIATFLQQLRVNPGLRFER